MDLSGARARRVLDAISDLTSYRLLWAGLTGRVMPLKDIEWASGPVGEFGIPDDTPSDSETQIPRIIFQTWKSRHEMPAKYRYWRRSFLLNNPNFRCFLWDDKDNRLFVTKRFPWFLDRYDSYPREIFRADIIRFFFLYVYGGFYADMDSECLKPLENMRGIGDVLVGRMGYNNTFEHSIPNAIMASRPNQAIWLLAISFAAERLVQLRVNQPDRDVRPEWLTGPVLLKDAVDFYMQHTAAEISGRILASLPELQTLIAKADFGRVTILPPPIWYPVNWNNFMQAIFIKKMSKTKGLVDRNQALRLFPHAYIVTYWSASWKQ